MSTSENIMVNENESSDQVESIKVTTEIVEKIPPIVDNLSEIPSEIESIVSNVDIIPTNNEDDCKDDKMSKIKLLTYNVGLLDYRIGLIKLFSNPPYSLKRLPFIPVAIRRENADIVVLQEIYDEFHATFLTKELIDLYPYHARKTSGGYMRLHNGLLILSKWPIVDSKLVRFTKVSNIEYLLGSKSFLSATVEVPTIGKVNVINIHTTAGGESNPEAPDVDKLREFELIQSVDFIKEVNTRNEHCIFMGDFNCGPDASASNYKYLMEQGFRDLFLEAVENHSVASEEHFTWHPKNYLNTTGPHSQQGPQRIDHIMLPRDDVVWSKWKTMNAKILFTESLVPIDFVNKINSTISDHYGVSVEISLETSN